MLLNIRRRQITWACVVDGKPARLPVIIVCQKTRRWLVEFPDGSVDFVDPRSPQNLRVGLPPVPPT
jgi:hypothetical protein